MNNYQDYIGSFSFDQRLALYDIEGSIAHVKMLVKCKIILKKEGSLIIKGLESIASDLKNGWNIPKQEDIHYAIEKELIKRIGNVGGKMHTARSRNDQTVLDLRLYLRSEIEVLKKLLKNIQKTIIDKAEKNINVILPGYTHLQPAQPVLFAHHLLAYGWMFSRDIERLEDNLKRINILPLGSAALGGTSFPIDRKYTAELLGFSKVGQNSMDSVSDRDFAVEVLSSLSIISMHLSRLAEELIIWSSAEFEFIRLDDEFTSGSSIMPQKKNPDIAEIIRGKTGRVFGDLFAFLTIMKGLPLTYNRDLQEDKPPLFDACDTVKNNLDVMNEMLLTMKIYPDKMLKACERGFLEATELADYLAKKGVPFRQAHGTIKDIVNYCIQNNKVLKDLSINEFKKFDNLFEKDIYNVLKPENIIQKKSSYGGTSLNSVRTQIKELKRADLK